MSYCILLQLRKLFLRQALQTLKGPSIPQTLIDICEFPPRHIAIDEARWFRHKSGKDIQRRFSALIRMAVLVKSPETAQDRPMAAVASVGRAVLLPPLALVLSAGRAALEGITLAL